MPTGSSLGTLPAALDRGPLAFRGDATVIAGTNIIKLAGGAPGAQGWDDVLAIDKHSGANDPHIDTGRFINIGTTTATQVTGHIRSSGNLFIHPDTGFEVQAHDAIHIHGPDTVVIESTGGSDVTLATSTDIHLNAGADISLNAGTFVGIVGGFVRFIEKAASTPSMAAGQALFWVRNDTPNRPMFTDDTNVDARIALLPLPLTDLATQAADTFLGNFTGSPATPTALAGATVAGAGLTYTTGGILAVGAGTRITVNANDVQLAAGAAESFLMNATAGSAVADYRAGSSVAGGGLTYTAGGTLAVGAGTNVTVNANDVSVTNFPLSGLATQAAETFLGNFTAGAAVPTALAGSTVAGAGLTYTSGGILAVGAGTGITVNANDVQLSALAADTFFGNFTAGSAVGVAVAGSTVAGAGLTYTTGGILAVGAGTNVTVNANDVSVTNFPLTGLAAAAANTVIANATAGSAAPTAVAIATDSVLARVGGNLVSHPWATLAGTYLSYSAGVFDWIGLDVRANSGANAGTRHRLNVIGTSPITVAAADDGANDEVDVTISVSAIPLSSLANAAALTVIANATNASAAPTAVASAADDTVFRRTATTLNWGQLTVGMAPNDLWTYAKIQNVSATSRFLGRITAGAGDIEELTGTQATSLLDVFGAAKGLVPASAGGTTNFLRADGTFAAPTGTFTALSGAIVSTGTGGASTFAGILDNGAAENNRTNLNFLNSTTINATVTDDAGNDELEIAYAVNQGATYTWTGAHTHNGATHTVSASGNMTLQALGAYSLIHNGGDAISIASDDATGAALKMEAAVSAAGVSFVGPGDGMFWLLGSGANNARPMYREGADNDFPLVGKPLNLCYWYDDFHMVSGSLGTSILFCGDGSWLFDVYGAAGGSATSVVVEANHPGILRLSTHTVSGTAAGIYRGVTAGTGVNWVRGEMIREFNAIVKLTNAATAGFFIGFSSDPNLQDNLGSNALTTASDFLGFYFDTAGAFTDTTVHCCSREASGTALNTDSNIAPTAATWRKYTIRQNVLGTVEYLIDGAVVATHASQIPDTEAMNCGVVILTRDPSGLGTAARIMDVDYIDFLSHVITR